ncbi:PepSY-associated TM helix domain-containing protein [Streptomyces zingiberis]|uniref:PepSY domain-containing protein n=1 Tax=Streptomyces zingiberis TaxID=2053010 RepID=A0ABX1BTZ9_9ACTN|nr:PepSY-associated TM helix domain-containing protein [Streptomyces zingiberis]NJP99702.1 PepSY domain-containing protein [Streptomyces zingiberis]
MSIDDPARPETPRPAPPDGPSGPAVRAGDPARADGTATAPAVPAARAPEPAPATAATTAGTGAATTAATTVGTGAATTAATTATAAPATPTARPGDGKGEDTGEGADDGGPAVPPAADGTPAGPPPSPPEGAGSPAPSPRASRAGLRPLVLRLHFYAGLLVAPFLLVAAVTGLLYAASYQIEKVVYADELTAPVPEGGKPLPLDEQVRAAVEANPDGTLGSVWASPGDGTTTRVLFPNPALGESRSDAVFVDPYTAEVRGELVSYGGSGALPVRAWISELHRHLHLGEPGRLYSELAASWLWVVALGGLVLWLRRRRATRGARGVLLPERGATGRRRTMSRHGAIGVWALPGLLFLSATGLTWSAYAGENIGVLREQLRGATPAITATVDPSADGAAGGHEGHGGAHGDTGHQPGAGGDVGLDRVVETARAEGVTEQLVITMPADENGAYVVTENDTQWPVHFDAVSVHPTTGETVDTLAFADYPVLAQLTQIGIDAHMGQTLGLFNQILLAALMVGLIALIVYGYRMWWQRRPTRGAAFAFGRPIPRGAWRKAPPATLAVLLVAAVLVGWFVPLFGLGLLLFLAVDLVLGAIARSRRRRATGTPAG